MYTQSCITELKIDLYYTIYKFTVGIKILIHDDSLIAEEMDCSPAIST